MYIKHLALVKHMHSFKKYQVLLQAMKAKVDQDSVRNLASHLKHFQPLRHCSLCHVMLVMNNHTAECYQGALV